jgi:hypothetical protein
MGYEDPEIAQARAAQGLLGGTDMGDPEALREAARNTNDPRVKASLVDRALEIEKTQADIGRLNALASGGGRTGGGTGNERMIQYIADVRSRIAVGEEVSPREIEIANGYAQVLQNTRVFQTPTGEVLRVPANDIAAIQRVQAQGGVEMPQPAIQPIGSEARPPATTQAPASAPARPQIDVIETPTSVRKRKEEEEAKAKGSEVTMTAAQTVFEDAGRAIETLNQYGSRAAGWGSLLRFMPESKALELDGHIESIKGNVGIDSLLKIKASGAGLGQIPQSQLEMLASLLGRLDIRQSPDVLRQNINRIQEIYQDIVEKEGGDPLAKAQERGFLTGTSVPQAAPTTPTQRNAIIDRVMADPRNAGRSRQQVERALKQRGYIK